MRDRDVFHPGELAVQVRAGERDIAAGRTSLIRSRLNEAATAFVESQQLVAIAAADADGALWTSLWSGGADLLRGNDDGASLTVHHRLDQHPADVVRSIVRPGEPVGLLVIDLETRRRVRINGRIRRADRTGLDVAIHEAYGNCPKYIQQRVHADAALDAPASDVAEDQRQGQTLDDATRGLIARSDTAFVASAHRDRGLDVSHRGGHPGFVRVVDDRTLRVPDYRGNSLFQTLGNLELDQRCGLTFVDFEQRRLLAASGHAYSEFGVEDPTHPTGGTGRYWTFTLDRWILFPLLSATHWTLVERSPFNPT